MKTLYLLISLLAATAILLDQSTKSGTGDVENEIRRLDLEEAEAILKKDGKEMDRLTSEDLTVNSPRNEVVKGREAVKSLFVDGVIDYKSFNREVESVTIYDNTAIVMGRETVVTQSGPNAPSQTVNRRYTNIWPKRNGQWVLSARQASIICPP